MKCTVILFTKNNTTTNNEKKEKKIQQQQKKNQLGHNSLYINNLNNSSEISCLFC